MAATSWPASLARGGMPPPGFHLSSAKPTSIKVSVAAKMAPSSRVVAGRNTSGAATSNRLITSTASQKAA